MRLEAGFWIGIAAAVLVVGGCGPRDGSSEYTAGKAAYEVRDLKKATRCLEKCVRLAPDNVDALVYLVRIGLDLGEIPQAAKWLTKAEALAGNDRDVRILGAQVAFYSKDSEKALRLFRAIADDAKLEPSVRSQGWTGLGVVEMTTENHQDLARIAFLRAIHLDRRNAAAWYHLGLLYRNSFGYYPAALEQLDCYVRLDAQASPRVQHTQQKIIPALKEMIARATTERPGVSKRNSTASAEALAKAEDAWKRGNYKTALQHYREALNQDALSFQAAVGLAKATLRIEPDRAGQLKALEYYRQACMLRPSSASVFLAAGSLAVQLGMQAAAVEIYSRAVAANPASLDALDGLIRALRKAGAPRQVPQAYQDYRDALAATRGGRR